jgi:hypothetical protein
MVHLAMVPTARIKVTTGLAKCMVAMKHSQLSFTMKVIDMGHFKRDSHNTLYGV